MNYKGIELKDISGTPKIIDPPKQMLVWNDSDNEPCVDYIYAIGPSSMNLPVRAISSDGWLGTHCYKHCAEIPKPHRATYRELSKWLAHGNGEVADGDINKSPYCKSSIYYESRESDKPCSVTLYIRKWNDNEWHEPTLDYMEMEEFG